MIIVVFPNKKLKDEQKLEKDQSYITRLLFFGHKDTAELTEASELLALIILSMVID